MPIDGNTYLKYTCPKCANVQYESQGDPNDPTGYDCDEIECEKCGFHERVFERED